jgi:Cysteine-rich domain
VGLFIPCYMDAFEPEVGIATLELLERLGCAVEYPVDQTYCGQPMANTGCHLKPPAPRRLFTGKELKVNTLAYLVQHLVVLLDGSAIVLGLQDAYAHPVFQAARYAVFHTGPAATADIEGVLIHGAQGVRSLTVIVDG